MGCVLPVSKFYPWINGVDQRHGRIRRNLDWMRPNVDHLQWDVASARIDDGVRDLHPRLLGFATMLVGETFPLEHFIVFKKNTVLKEGREWAIRQWHPQSPECTTLKIFA